MNSGHANDPVNMFPVVINTPAQRRTKAVNTSSTYYRNVHCDSITYRVSWVEVFPMELCQSNCCSQVRGILCICVWKSFESAVEVGAMGESLPTRASHLDLSIAPSLYELYQKSHYCWVPWFLLYHYQVALEFVTEPVQRYGVRVVQLTKTCNLRKLERNRARYVRFVNGESHCRWYEGQCCANTIP